MTDGPGPDVCCPEHKPNLVKYIKYGAVRLTDETDTKASVGGTASQSTYVKQGEHDLDLL
jgi:hypothetical protein